MFKPIIDIFRYVKMFQIYLGVRMYLIYALGIIASVFEGIGILMLLPLLQSLDNDSNINKADGGINEILYGLIDFLGFSDSIISILLLISMAFILKGIITFCALGLTAYLLGQLLKADKRMKSDLSYEDMYSTVEKMDDYIYHIEDVDKTPLEEFIREISANIKAELDHIKLTENEKLVGNALITVLDNWETIFEQVESGNKYNKNLILSYIRELSGLTTKDIRVSMRRYKKIFYALKNIKIDKGLL